MKAMYLAFVAIIVIGVGAGVVLNALWPDTAATWSVSDKVRLGD